MITRGSQRTNASTTSTRRPTNHEPFSSASPPMCRSVPPGVAFQSARAPRCRKHAAHAAHLRLSRRAAFPVRGRHEGPANARAVLSRREHSQLSLPLPPWMVRGKVARPRPPYRDGATSRPLPVQPLNRGVPLAPRPRHCHCLPRKT